MRRAAFSLAFRTRLALYRAGCLLADDNAFRNVGWYVTWVEWVGGSFVDPLRTED